MREWDTLRRKENRDWKYLTWVILLTLTKCGWYYKSKDIIVKSIEFNLMLQLFQSFVW